MADRRLAALLALALTAPVAGCGGPDARAAPPATRMTDSVVSRGEAVRRFRNGLAPVDSLSGGTPSLDSLVTAFVRALSASDTAALAGLAVSRAEYAYLYYPTATQARPPYDLEPGLMWFMLFEHSNQGIRRALQRHGGKPMLPAGHDCGSAPQREGGNLLHGPCLVRWTDDQGDTLTERLIGRVLEHDGRFKVLSYADHLD